MNEALPREINTNVIPDIHSSNPYNPTISSPNSEFIISFYQTRESLLDVEIYKRFIENAISRFRKSRTYKNYKAFLISIGLDRCQVHSNITSEMATLEMHHNMLTLFDIAFIICEHTIRTRGYISTFDLIKLLKIEHKEHRVQLVMLSLTPHQIYHNSDGMFLHPKHCTWADWIGFLEKYNQGITIDIGYKLVSYLNMIIKTNNSTDSGLLQLRDQVEDWSAKNTMA